MEDKKIKFNIAPFIVDIKEEDVDKYYFTSDLHLNHKNILYYTERYKLTSSRIKEEQVIELKEKLISNINSVVPEYGILVNCGDVMLSGLGSWEEDLDQIKCKKHYIVLGNHDYGNILKRKNLSMGYDPDAKIQFSNMIVFRIWKGDKILKMFTVTHMPQDDFVGGFNIHGHLHTPKIADSVKDKCKDYDIMKKFSEDGRHFDCGVDRNDYKPVSLSAILEGKTDIKYFK